MRIEVHVLATEANKMILPFVRLHYRFADELVIGPTWDTESSTYDWLFLVTANEFVHAPCGNVRAVLGECEKLGATVLRCEGYRMVGENTMPDGRALIDEVRWGKREPFFDRFVVVKGGIEISRDLEMNITSLRGDIRLHCMPTFMLLNYEFASLEYAIDNRTFYSVKTEATEIL